MQKRFTIIKTSTYSEKVSKVKTLLRAKLGNEG
jgi:hypothetical protein